MRHVMAVHWKCDLISCHMFTWITIELHVCSLFYCENDLGDESLWTGSIILSLYVGNKLHKWETIKILVQKHIKCAKNAFHPEILILLRWGILLTGKCMLIAADNFGTQLFCLLEWKFLKWGHLKWVVLYINIYLKSVASSVFSRGVFKTNLVCSNGSIIQFFSYKFLLNFSSCIPQLAIEKATYTVFVTYLLFHIIISWTIIVVFYILILEVL